MNQKLSHISLVAVAWSPISYICTFLNGLCSFNTTECNIGLSRTESATFHMHNYLIKCQTLYFVNGGSPCYCHRELQTLDFRSLAKNTTSYFGQRHSIRKSRPMWAGLNTNSVIVKLHKDT